MKRGPIAIRCGQHWNDIEHLNKRGRPAVKHQQRNSICAIGHRMNKMYVETINFCFEVVKAIQARLLCFSIVFCPPVCRQIGQIGCIRAIPPTAACDLVWHARGS